MRPLKVSRYVVFFDRLCKLTIMLDQVPQEEDFIEEQPVEGEEETF